MAEQPHPPHPTDSTDGGPRAGSGGDVRGCATASAQDRAADDAAYRAAVVDLLGALAYGELTAFSRLAADADLAPTLPDKASLGRQSAHEFRHYELLEARLQELSA